MSKSAEDLKAAFAGESQANRKYTYFAEKAEQDGYPQAARLFRAAAHAEAIHARNHLKALGALKSTAENLDVAIEGENYEVDTMYPEFIQDAQAEGDKKALRTFEWAYEVEKIHAQMYSQMRKDLEHPGAETDYYVCPVCGYTHAGPMTEKCPVCGVAPEKFEHFA